MGVIYVATFPNGYKYVGQTSQPLNKRIAQHRSDSKTRNHNKTIPFYNAINKYGFDNITWEVVDNYENKEDGNKKEKCWIEHLRTYVHFDDCAGYNATLGGNSRAELTCLSEAELILIGDEYRQGYSAQILSEKYDVPLWTMQAIFRGDQWADYTKISPRQSFVPHGSIYSLTEVDEILSLYKEEGNIFHVYVRFKEKYKKGSCASIRSIIKGLTWSEYTNINSDEFYKRYLRIDNRDRVIKKRIINQEIADEIRAIYEQNHDYTLTLDLISQKHDNVTINIIKQVVQRKTWNNN